MWLRNIHNFMLFMSFEWANAHLSNSRVDRARLITKPEIWKQTRNCLVVSKLKIGRQFSNFPILPHFASRLSRFIINIIQFQFQKSIWRIREMAQLSSTEALTHIFHLLMLLNLKWCFECYCRVHQMLQCTSEMHPSKRFFKLKVRQLRSYLC